MAVQQRAKVEAIVSSFTAEFIVERESQSATIGTKCRRIDYIA
jgi:hypothetical protein